MEQFEHFIVKKTTLENSESFAKILVIKLYTKKYYFCILKSLIFQTTILIPQWLLREHFQLVFSLLFLVWKGRRMTRFLQRVNVSYILNSIITIMMSNPLALMMPKAA